MAVKKSNETKAAAKTTSSTKTGAGKAASSKTASAKKAATKKAAVKPGTKKTSAKEEESKTLFDPIVFRRELDTYLTHTLHTDFENAEVFDLYKAVSTLVNRELGTMRTAYNKERFELEKKNVHRKKICYICMEFLMGQSLKNNLYNLGQTELVASIMKERGVEMEDLTPQAIRSAMSTAYLSRRSSTVGRWKCLTTGFPAGVSGSTSVMRMFLKSISTASTMNGGQMTACTTSYSILRS